MSNKKRAKKYPKAFAGLSVAVVPILKALRRWEAAALRNQHGAARRGWYTEAALAGAEAVVCGDLAYNFEALARGDFSDFDQRALRIGGKSARRLGE